MLRKTLAWMAEEAWEKVNLPAKWREIKETAREWGPRFIVVAVVWEIIEDGLFGPTVDGEPFFPDSESYWGDSTVHASV